MRFAPRSRHLGPLPGDRRHGGDVGLNDIEAWDDRDVSSYLLDRSRNWRNLFDPSTGFIRPKNADGSWVTPFDPLSPEDFVEANAWQATWFVSHDVMGLANLMGGEEAYANKLNFAFNSAEPSNFIADYGDGYVSYGNQPGLQMAHMFNYVGYPWLTQHWVRQVKEKTYGAVSTTDGYGHFDEDQGQMGAISVLMAIGLFEVTGGGHARPGLRHHLAGVRPGDDRPGPALLPRQAVRDRHARQLGEEPVHPAGEARRARVDNAWFHHSALADGGRLELWLGDQPNKRWGVSELPPSESASEDRHPVNVSKISISGPDRCGSRTGPSTSTPRSSPRTRR